MANKLSYAAAMKMYFQQSGKPVHFPKKGDADHKAICALMASGDIASGSGVSAEAAVATGEVKPKKIRAKKDAPMPKKDEDVPIKPEGTTLIDQPHVNKKSVSEIEEKPEAPPVKKRKPRAVKADGLSPEANHLKSLTEQNAHIQVAPADYPDLKKQIEKVLDVKPEGIPESKKKLETNQISRSKTIVAKKAPDMKAIEERAPFSFASIKQLLRQ